MLLILKGAALRARAGVACKAFFADFIVETKHVHANDFISGCAQYEQHMVLELIKMGHETPAQKARRPPTPAPF